MMHKQSIWFAVVGITPLKGNEIIKGSKGAHVNVACMAESEENFKKKLIENFKYHKCKVFEIDDIERKKDLTIVREANAEKINLLKEIQEGYKFAWGTFFTF